MSYVNTGLKLSRADLIAKLKEANRLLGRQGRTIADLRRLEQALSESSKIERGELRRITRRNQILEEDVHAAVQEITVLRTALDGKQTPFPEVSAHLAALFGLA